MKLKQIQYLIDSFEMTFNMQYVDYKTNYKKFFDSFSVTTDVSPLCSVYLTYDNHDLVKMSKTSNWSHFHLIFKRYMQTIDISSRK